MKINKLLTKYNHDKGSVSRIEYIVIHYVGALGGAKGNCQWYAECNRNASAHYYVDHDGSIWQSVEDANIAWHCGSATGYKHPKCRNGNSIGIEMCVRKKNTKTLWASDKDWYFEDATVASTIELTKYLMKKYDIPVENVIRHYDVTGKICPNPYVYNYTKHTWDEFKKALTAPEKADNNVVEKPLSGKVRVTYTGMDGIEVHNTPDFESSSCNKFYGPVGPNTAHGSEFTVVALVTLPDGNTMYKLKSGLYITTYKGYVEFTPNEVGTVINCSYLNVHTAPNSKVFVGKLQGGEQVPIVGEGKDSDGDVWYKISTDDFAGYVWPKYIKR
jgi:N-acetyl-anhydromuramyl-L-alanine amidase AmpD